MTSPIANNNLKSNQLFEYRKYYRDLYYPKDNTNIIDFWNNSLMYGKINNDLDPVIMDIQNLKPLKLNNPFSTKANYLINFAADSFQEFLKEFQLADQQRVIQKSKLNPLKIEKGSLLPNQEYKIRIVNVLETLMKNDLNQFNNKLLTFDDYLKLFCTNMDIAAPIITQTSFVTSKLFSPLSTGLVFELSSLDHGTDIKKDQEYLKDPNYKFLINTAEKYSFFVDKNAPWRLIFNLNTEYAKNKFSNYNCSSIDDVHSNLYSPTYLNDWILIKENLIKHYNEQALKKSKVQIPYYCENSEDVRFNTITKQNALEEQYNELFWVKLYYYIRLKEEQLSMNQNQFNIKLNHLDSIYRTSGLQFTLKWINQQTKLFLDGGTNPSYNQHIKVEKSKLKNNSSFLLII